MTLMNFYLLCLISVFICHCHSPWLGHSTNSSSGTSTNTDCSSPSGTSPLPLLPLPLEELRAISAKCFGLYECGQLASIFSCNYRSPVARLIDFDAGQRQPSELNGPLPPPYLLLLRLPLRSGHLLHPCSRRQQQLVCAVRDAAAFCRSAKTIRACSPGSKSCCSREAAPPPLLPCLITLFTHPPREAFLIFAVFVV